MKTINIDMTKQIIPKHQFLFVDNERNRQVDEIAITSGRSGAKSSAVALYGNVHALKSRTAIVYMRKNHNKLKQTVFAESKRAFSRLGMDLKRDTKTTENPMKIVVHSTGSTIYFTGSDNPDDTKGMIDENASISLVVIDELTEFFKMGYERGKEELENIKATFVRGNTGDFKIIYLFNPPKNPNHAVMRFINEKKYIYDEQGNNLGLNKRFRHVHSTYLDTPPEWQGDRLLESALETKRQDEDYYNWLWLGQSVGVDEIIYYMFNEDKHVNEYKGEPLYNIGIGVDYGQMNATTFNAFGINANTNKLQGIKSYEHSGRDTRKQKSPSEYANDMLQFIKEVEELTRDKVRFIVIDPSAKGLAEEVKRVLNKNRYNIPIRPAQNSIAEGISRVQVLLMNEAIVLDKSMEKVFSEFKSYAYDQRQIEKGVEVPVQVNDHHMDGIRYLVMEQYAIMKQRLNLLEE